MDNDKKGIKILEAIVYLLIPTIAYLVILAITHLVQNVAMLLVYGSFVMKNYDSNMAEIATTNVLSESINILYMTTVVIFVILFLVVYRKTKIVQISGIQMKSQTRSVYGSTLISGVFIGALLNILLNAFQKYIPADWLQANQENVEALRAESVFLTIITVSVAAPILEEIMFRGFLYNCMKKLTGKIWLSTIITSVMFGIFHGNILQGIYAAVLSLAMIWIYEKSNSIRTSIVFHGAVNFSSYIAIIFLVNFGYYISSAICVILGALGVFLFVKSCKKSNLREEQEIYLEN